MDKSSVTESNLGGSLVDLVTEINHRGGVGIPVSVDHRDDKQVEALFQKISAEQDGCLDILVNNAFQLPTDPDKNANGSSTDLLFRKFWEQPGQYMNIAHDLNVAL